MSVLSTRRRVQENSFDSITLPILVKKTVAMFKKEFDGYLTPSPKLSITFFFGDFVRLKHRLLVQEKEQHLFWHPPGSVFDPNCMEPTSAGATPITISSEDADKYRVVICVWPSLNSVKEDVDWSRVSQEYEHALLEKRPWQTDYRWRWKEWETNDSATVMGRAVVVVEISV
jgi:hypothetical protein